MSSVRLWLLGPPRVEHARNSIVFGTRKATALITYLAVTGQFHTRETLIAVLWPDYDAEQALAALRTTLWTVRRQLGDKFLAVTRQQIGVDFSGDVWIDVREFLDMAERGLARARSQADTTDLLEQAVSLYQGDFMAGFTLKDSLEFDEWQLLQTQRLRQMFGRVLERLVQSATDQGMVGQALVYAQRQVGFDPLDEAAHRNVMRLYALTGQRTAALRQFEACQRVLDQQMGIDPAEETRQLREAIEAGDLRPGVLPAALAETVTSPVRRGDTGPLLSQGLQAHLYERAEMVLQKPRRLVGRETLIDTINRLLDENETILLHGLGGIGKTSLAATIAADRITSTGQPVIWLEAGRASADTLFEAVAHACGQEQAIARKAGDERLVAIRELLLQKSALVVLDNAWNIEALCRFLKAIPPGIPVLVTSRQRVPVGPIVDVTELAPADALALVSYHAHQEFHADAAGAQALCDMLGFHPLALEIAGKTLYVDDLTPAELIHRVGSSPHQMTMPRSFADEGRQSIKDLIDVSIAALSPPALETFLAFGALFSTTATQELIALCLGQPCETIAGLLSDLRGRGLVERLRSIEAERPVFRVHDLTYSYARANAQLTLRDTLNGCQAYIRAHLGHLDALEVEISNLLGAARAAHLAGSTDQLVEVMRLLAVEAEYFSARGYSIDAIDLLGLAAQAAETAGQIEHAHYLFSKLGNAYLKYTEQFDRAFESYSHALNLAQQLHDCDREVLMLALLGTSCFHQGLGDPDLYYERAYQQAQTTNNAKALATVLNHRSYYEGQKSPPDYERSRLFSDEAVSLARHHSMHEFHFASLVNRGNCERLSGQIESALATHGEALALAEQHDNHFWRASALRDLGEDWHTLGDRDQAQACFDQSLALSLAADAIPRARSLIDFMSGYGYSVNRNTLEL